MATQPTPPPSEPTYSRAACLYTIIATAAFQLQSDARDIEQEKLALLSRISTISEQLRQIIEQDPLLK